jgi:phosphonate transport system ATP-binding protein
VDPRLAESIVTLLLTLARESGKTLLMSLHSVDLALAHFPRVVGLRGGRVAFDLPPRAVTPRLLADLYAGAAPEPEVDPATDGALHDIPLCRPLA